MESLPNPGFEQTDFRGTLISRIALTCYALTAILLSAYMGVTSEASPCALATILTPGALNVGLAALMLVVQGALPLVAGMGITSLTYVLLQTRKTKALGGWMSAAAILPLFTAWHYVDAATSNRTKAQSWLDPLVAYCFYVVYIVLPAVAIATVIRRTQELAYHRRGVRSGLPPDSKTAGSRRRTPVISGCVLAFYGVAAVLLFAHLGIGREASSRDLAEILLHDASLTTVMVVVKASFPVLAGVAIALLTYLFLQSWRTKVIAIGISIAAILPLFAVQQRYAEAKQMGEGWWVLFVPVNVYGFFVVYVVLPAIAIAALIQRARN